MVARKAYNIERWSGISAPNIAMLRLTLTQEGYDVSHWSDRPGTFCGSHMHDDEQSHWVISGVMELEVERVGTFRLGPGDRDYMPPLTYHTARVIGDEPAIYLVGSRKE